MSRQAYASLIKLELRRAGNPILRAITLATFAVALHLKQCLKSMRLLRELVTRGEIKGDPTTLEDFQVIAKIREGDE